MWSVASVCVWQRLDFQLVKPPGLREGDTRSSPGLPSLARARVLDRSAAGNRRRSIREGIRQARMVLVGKDSWDAAIALGFRTRLLRHGR
jgi:hypothetical protein